MATKLVRLDTIARAHCWHLADRMALVDRRGNRYVVTLTWSRNLKLRHEATFANADGAVKLMQRINDVGRITPSCWLMQAR